MRRIAALVCLLVVTPLAGATGDETAAATTATINVDHVIGPEHCRAETPFDLWGQVDCATHIAGTITLSCDSDACDAAWNLVATGTRATVSTVQPSHVGLQGNVVGHDPAVNGTPGSTHGNYGCQAAARTQMVSCALVGGDRYDFWLANLFGDGRDCFWIGVLAESQTYVPVAGGRIVSHESRGATPDNDTRPESRGWHGCGDDDGNIEIHAGDFVYT